MASSAISAWRKRSATWAAVTGSLGRASSSCRQTAAAAALRSASGCDGVAQEQPAPVAEGVGVVRLGLVHRLVLGGGLGELLLLDELADQGLPQLPARRGELDRLLEPGPRLGEPALRGQAPAEPDDGLDVLGVRLDPALVVLGQARLVVVAEEDLLDLAADLAVEPALGPELAQERLEVGERLRRSGPRRHLEVGRRHRAAGPAGTGPWPSSARLSNRGRACSAWPSSARAVAICSWTRGSSGKSASSRAQTASASSVFWRPLVDPAQGLEDLEQVVPLRLAGEGPLERLGRLVGLADQDQRLAQVVATAAGRRAAWPRPAGRRSTAAASLPALRLQQAEDHPADAVLRVLRRRGSRTS